MDYGRLFEKAWDLIWKNKFMILLGVLVAAGSSGDGGLTRGFPRGNGADFQQPPRFDFSAPLQSLDLPVMPMIGLGLFAGLVVLVGLAFWVLSTISRAGLIEAANRLSQGESSTFSAAFQAGWAKAWRMIGIGLVPGIPVLLLAVIAFGSAGIYGGFSQVFSEGEILSMPRTGAFLPVGIVACLLVPLAFGLSLLRTFANRACMLEDATVWTAYRRGFEVLGSNLGHAVVLFLIQVAIRIGIWLVLLLPGILIALCCFLWPIFLLIQGTFTAWYSSVWTLSWNRWTRVPEVVPEAVG